MQHAPEIHDNDEAVRFLQQGLWFQRFLPPAADSVKRCLEWVAGIVSEGVPLPPPGFVADLGHFLFQMGSSGSRKEERGIPGIPLSLLRTYEDYILGRLYSDWTIDKAVDACRKYTVKERPLVMAFVVARLQEKAGVSGVILPMGAIRQLLSVQPLDLLHRGWEAFERVGSHPMLAEHYSQLAQTVRRAPDLLSNEDLLELNRKTAISEFGQRVALRQFMQAIRHFDESLPKPQSLPPVSRRQVSSRVLDEDRYPVGGYTSISNRGSIESLLHSQLAYMEKEERPDLFDLKYLRDELLFFSRDDNEFLRPRRTFLFVLYPNLEKTRFKPSAQPWQLISLLFGCLSALIRRLSEVLSTDALQFRFVCLDDRARAGLQPELDLLHTIFLEQVELGTVVFDKVRSEAAIAALCEKASQRSLTQALLVSRDETDPVVEEIATANLVVAEKPQVISATEEVKFEGLILEPWEKCAEYLLRSWL